MKEPCGAWMPRAKENCASGAGHKDFHRSAASVERNVVSSAVWRAANREQIAAYHADYRAANREQLAAKRAANRERIAARFAAWAAANPEKIQAKSAARRALKAGLPATLTADEQIQLLADYNECCAYCGQPLAVGHHWDHVVPLSQGGPWTYDNIVPACPPCNHQKHARTPDESGMPWPPTATFRGASAA